jgi:hypothetical protein
MKYLAIFLVFVLALALPGSALARGLADDRVVFGDNFTLRNGETQDGNLVVFGGNVVMETGSRVTGDVVLMGGNLSSDGTVEGNIVGLGAVVSLGETAVVEGDITTIGANLERAEGARIEGQVFSNLNSPLTFSFPAGVRVPRFDVRFSPALNAAGFILKVFLWAALAVLLVLFLPVHTRRVSQTAITQPLIAGGLGLLTVVALPVLVLALAITILLIPVSLLVVALAALAWIFGLIALGLEVGDRLARLLNQEWAPALAAGIGTFALILVLNGIQQVVPCVGWIAPAIAGIVGLGAVLLTRFGLQTYPPATASMVVTTPPETIFTPPPPQAPEPPQPPEEPSVPPPPEPPESDEPREPQEPNAN